MVGRSATLAGWFVGWTGFAQKIAMNIAHGKMLGFNGSGESLCLPGLSTIIIHIQVSLGCVGWCKKEVVVLSDLIFFTSPYDDDDDVCSAKWNP